MNKVEIPSAGTVTGWSGEKTALGKDKAVAAKLSAETTKLTDAIKALDSAAGKVDFGIGDAKGIASSSAAEAALTKLEDAVKGAVKTALGAAKTAAAAAATFAAAAEKAQKGLPTASQKVAVAAKGAAAAAAKAADKYASDLSAAVDAARDELQAKLKASDKKAAAPVKANPKALADGKTLSALMRKSIALLRTPKGSPLPIKFMVLFNKANPKDLRLYLGPKPESGLAKLKTQFPSDVKVNRVKDPKGKVVWDKGALTFLSDILKGGLAKQIQLAIRQQTKVTVKVRIKRSDGAVDEADAKDVSDDELKVSAAEEAEMLAAGKAWEAALRELAPAIQAALKGPRASDVKKLIGAIQAAGKAGKYDVALEGIDELESQLEEGNVADSDGKDLEADVGATGPGDKATGGGIDVSKLKRAREGWVTSRDSAVKGITDLSKAINAAFKKETAQAPAVLQALTKLGQLQVRLKSGLESDLQKAIEAKDENSRALAKSSLNSIRTFIETDELMKNLDHNDVDQNMEVVKPLKDSLKAIEEALG